MGGKLCERGMRGAYMEAGGVRLELIERDRARCELRVKAKESIVVVGGDLAVLQVHQ